MIHNISKTHSLANIYLNELRDSHIQKDALRFRKNIERLAQILAYEASKSLAFIPKNIQTPLGEKESFHLNSNIVIASILRAGLPMHYGVLSFFDYAENCFVSAYRKHSKSGDFEIKLEYIASPELSDKTLILCDPMVATGSSIAATLNEIRRYGQPNKIIILGIIGSVEGIDSISKLDNNMDIYIGDIDEELTAKGYIVPGLGDAGDLAFGEKMEN